MSFYVMILLYKSFDRIKTVIDSVINGELRFNKIIGYNGIDPIFLT